MKSRGRPRRTDAQIRAVVEFMEKPRASKAAAAKKFHTIEKNIENVLRDQRARSWAAATATMRQMILDSERSRAESIRRLAEAGLLARWRNPKLEFVQKALTREELKRRRDEPLSDVYEMAAGRIALRRSETQRARRKSTARTESQRK